MKKGDEEEKKLSGNTNISKTEISKIEQELLRLDPKIFEGLNPKKRQELIRTTMFISSQKTHSGPLPDSQTLREYNEIIPNGADRIMTVFEQQAAHRMGMENYVIKEQLRQSNLGQIFALTIGIVALICATFCIYSGYEWGGSILGAGGITGLVVAFIKGKDYQQKNLSSKKTP